MLAGRTDVASVVSRDNGLLELGLSGDDAAAAAVLAALVGSGQRVVSFAPAASDLEELFLQITDLPSQPDESATEAQA